MYKIAFFDLDGTLLDHEKNVQSDVREALLQLKKKNVQVLIATGREPTSFSHLLEDLEIDSYVSINGAYTVVQNQVVFVQNIEKEVLFRFAQFANAKGHPVVYVTHQGNYSHNPNHPDLVPDFAALKAKLPMKLPALHPNLSVHQLIVHCREDSEQQYLETFPELQMIRWSNTAMDGVIRGMSKVKGIKKVLEHLHIHPSEAVAFGDGMNDLEMLSYVGMGIAMGNAKEAVKQSAKWVTKPNHDGGILHGLKETGLIS